MSGAIAATNPTATAWRTVRLADVCQFKPPKSIPRKALEDDSPVSFVPMGDLGELTKHFEARTVRRFGEVVKGYTYFADGDVLCAKITPCFENGKLGIAQNLENGVGFGSSEFVVMRSNGQILPEFLYYYLSRDTFREAGQAVMSGAVGHKRVPKEYFENLEIPLPPLDEQKRIVAVLDQAFAALDRAHRHTEFNANDCDKLIEDTRNSIIEEAIGRGEKARLSDVTSIDSKLVDPQSPDTADLLHIGAGNMATGSDQLIDVKSSREEELKSGKYLFDEQAILYSKIRPYLRKVARPDFSGLCSADVYPLTPFSTLDRNFLFHLLLSARFTRYAIAGSDRAGMPKVNRKHLFDFEFRLPSYDTQQEAASRIDEALAKIRQVRQQTEIKLVEMTHLRSSLLQKAFSGGLG